MENKQNLSIDLKIEEFAREMGLQLRLIFLEKKPEQQVSLDKVVKPIAAAQTSKKGKVK